MKKLIFVAFIGIVAVRFSIATPVNVYQRLFSYFEEVQPSFCIDRSPVASFFEAPCRPDDLTMEVTLDQKISQLFMVSVDGSVTMPEFSKRFLSRTPPGAVLLFGRNISANTETLFSFIDSVSSGVVSSGAPVRPLICIDHEGGDVARLRSHMAPLLSARETAETLSVPNAEVQYFFAGAQLAAAGITLNLAPVAEFATETNESFLGSRAYGSSPEIASQYAAAAVRGFKRGGVGATVKHFPGNAAGDPHTALPVLAVSKDELYTRYILPFAVACYESPDAVLLSHVVCPEAFGNVPVCFSKTAVESVLQQQLGFDGVVISDDLCMGAVAAAGYSPEEAAVAALQAGCTLLMISGNESLRSIHAAVKTAVLDGTLPLLAIDSAYEKIIQLKRRYGLLTVTERTKQDRMLDLLCFYAAREFALRTRVVHAVTY